jgi:hypothetical protein
MMPAASVVRQAANGEGCNSLSLSYRVLSFFVIFARSLLPTRKSYSPLKGGRVCKKQTCLKFKNATQSVQWMVWILFIFKRFFWPWFFCSQIESTPAPLPLMETVGLLLLLHSAPLKLSRV